MPLTNPFQHPPRTSSTPPGRPARRKHRRKRYAIDGVELDDVTPRDHEWVWFPYLLSREINLVAGASASGKTTFCLHMISRLTRGEPFHRSHTDPLAGSAVIITHEDAADTQIRPKIDRMGGDPSKIFYVYDVYDRQTDTSSFFDVVTHCDAIRDLCDRMRDVRVLLIDPLPEFMDNTNTNDNRQVRLALRDLHDLSREYNLTILAVTHFNKKEDLAPQDRIMGSGAFVAASRSLLMFAKELDEDGDGTGRSFMWQEKSNCHGLIKPPKLGFRMPEGAVEIEPEPIYGRVVDLIKGQLTSATPNGRPRDPRTVVYTHWLADLASTSTIVQSKALLEKGHALGISKTTIYRLLLESGWVKRDAKHHEHQ